VSRVRGRLPIMWRVPVLRRISVVTLCAALGRGLRGRGWVTRFQAAQNQLDMVPEVRFSLAQ
jgi:hypothetical protein